jgi:hypothetical protein
MRRPGQNLGRRFPFKWTNLPATLFYDAPILITNRDGRRTRRAMRFRDPDTALTWSISRACSFVFVPASNPRFKPS